LAIMQHLSSIWGDVLAWAVILAGLVTFAGLIVGRDRRRAPARPVTVADANLDLAAPEGSRSLTPEREWALVLRHATHDLERGASVAALQEDAALKIGAAEHAFNRLVTDCANLCPTSATPAVAATLEGPAERRPLAA
jgi:hypothetical protein